MRLCQYFSWLLPVGEVAVPFLNLAFADSEVGFASFQIGSANFRTDSAVLGTGRVNPETGYDDI